jgi:predicted amidophosphoribosyltransferase
MKGDRMVGNMLDIIRSEIAEMRTCDRCGALLPTHYRLCLCPDCREETLEDALVQN